MKTDEEPVGALVIDDLGRADNAGVGWKDHVTAARVEDILADLADHG